MDQDTNEGVKFNDFREDTKINFLLRYGRAANAQIDHLSVENIRLGRVNRSLRNDVSRLNYQIENARPGSPERKARIAFHDKMVDEFLEQKGLTDEFREYASSRMKTDFPEFLNEKLNGTNNQKA